MIACRVIVSQRIPRGMCLMYHAPEKIVNTPGSELSGATIFPAPAYGAGSNTTTRTAEEPYLSTLKEQLRTRALDTRMDRAANQELAERLGRKPTAAERISCPREKA